MAWSLPFANYLRIILVFSSDYIDFNALCAILSKEIGTQKNNNEPVGKWLSWENVMTFRDDKRNEKKINGRKENGELIDR